MFKELDKKEKYNIEGGGVFTIIGTIVTIGISAYGGIYKLGEAQGRNYGYKLKYRQGCG